MYTYITIYSIYLLIDFLAARVELARCENVDEHALVRVVHVGVRVHGGVVVAVRIGDDEEQGEKEHVEEDLLEHLLHLELLLPLFAHYGDLDLVEWLRFLARHCRELAAAGAAAAALACLLLLVAVVRVDLLVVDLSAYGYQDEGYHGHLLHICNAITQ